MKNEDKMAYGIVAFGICIVLPSVIFAVHRHSPSPVAMPTLRAAPASANPPVAVNSEAAQNAPPIGPDQFGPGFQQSDSDAARPAPQLTTAVVATLGKEELAPFVRKYNPAWDPGDAQHLAEPLWKAQSGSVKTTFRDPKHDVYIVLYKSAENPSAVGLAFPINQDGWILIPPEWLARIVMPDKPVSDKIQAGLDRFFGALSAKLYATGEGRGLILFGHGDAMKLEIKEDPKFPESLIFKTTFLRHSSYEATEFDPEWVVAWQDETSIKTSSHGRPRSDGWLTFEMPRFQE